MVSTFNRCSGFKLFKQYRNFCTMSGLQINTDGLPLKDVVTSLRTFADPALAGSWDNVGLLIEPTDPKFISHALVTNDLTEAVMREAIDLRVDLIIAYHPPIFTPLKSITTNSWKERIVIKCMENKIALYSPHTSFDSIQGGVNDWLASAFSIESSKPIQVGFNENCGMGRLCQLAFPISINEAVDLVKKLTQLEHVRLARSVKSNSTINTVAICAGSGTSVLQNVVADLYLTGEMFHHDVLDAVHKGIHVILTNHSDSERGYLKVFASKFSQILNNSVKISVSERDADPLTTV
ncbi:NIF3-like protein 1 isoform X3 [Prorops nasuta]|uniref:NIF3-like protein 1 isoform X3 n=1 Tax=Prorops nasuta TaxID=863751 RepID=UPI0034CF2ED8